jgi:hypothetical protein
MLNIYKYFDEPSSLSLYDKFADGFNILNHQHKWGREIPAEDLEPFTGMIRRDPEYAFHYARGVIQGRWPEAEPTIKESPTYACWYAEFILARDPEWTSIPGHENGRWPEAEPYIMKDPYDAYQYARQVIRKRWPEAEPYIKRSPDDWWKYNRIFKVD